MLLKETFLVKYEETETEKIMFENMGNSESKKETRYVFKRQPGLEITSNYLDFYCQEQ